MSCQWLLQRFFVYCCNCTDLPTSAGHCLVMARWLVLMVWVCLIEKMTYGQCKSEILQLIYAYQNLMCISLAGTVGFYLNGVAYPDGSTVLRTDIGIDAAALQCTTDSTTCCTNILPEMRGGNFYFPIADGGGVVPNIGGATNGYYRDRLSRHVRLHRQHTGTITGQFRCEIPLANGTMVNLFINIGKYAQCIVTCI